MSDTYVIVGAGHAAGQLAASLREEGFDGRILMIGEEPYVPYQRPPLSKKFLAKEIGIDRVYFRPPEFYEQANVEMMLSTRVSAIDRDAKRVILEDGKDIAYDKLALTTGSRVRRLPVPGATLDGVFYLRTIEDVEKIQDYFGPNRQLVIIGGGYIGLEIAAVAAHSGVDVTVLEMEERVMARVVAPEVSRFFEKVHRDEGVTIELNARVARIDGESHVDHLVTADGATYEADFVVVGIGIEPNVDLARDAGLDCDNGIVVDEFARTADPDIVAAGDCTNHPNSLLRRRLRLESVHNALEQAKTAAATMCGKEKPYAQVPWFWSDQYDLKLQIVGLSEGYDQVVIRGDMEKRAFAAFYLKDGVVLAVDAVNSPREYMMSRKWIADGVKVDPLRLADTSIAVKEVA